MKTEKNFALSVAAVAVIAASGNLYAAEPIQPIEPVKEINLDQVELGKKLYFDPRLSKSGFIAAFD